MTLSSLLLTAAAGTAAAGIVGAFLPARLAALLAAAVPATLFVFLVELLPVTAAGGVVVDSVPWVPSLGIALDFRIDGFSMLFGLLITGIGTLVVIYAGGYYAKKKATDRTRFLMLILAFMLAMLGTVFSDNLIVLFVFWEATSLISFALIGFNAEDRGARQAALQSLLVTAGGGLALFAGVLLIGIVTGSFSLSSLVANPAPVIESPYFVAIVVLVCVGAFTKSAQVPFHFWLPRAMAAPTPASAYLHSATMVKLGVFILARFDPAFGDTALFSVTLMTFGAATMIVAAIQALRSQGVKAVLAYSTVASLATLVMLVGVPGPEAEVAMVGFLFAHALYKATLFFCAGVLIYATDLTRLRQMGGLATKLPVTALATVLASLSMAGLPFFVGYAAKDLLFAATVFGDATIVLAVVTLVTNVVLVAIAAVVTLQPFFRAAPAGREVAVAHRPNLFLVLPPLVLASLGIVTGFAPQAGTLVVGPAAAALGDGPSAVALKVVPHLDLKLVLTLLIAAAGVAIAWNWNRIHRVMRFNRVVRAVSAEKGYDVAFAGIFSIGRWQTRIFQRGTIRTYTAFTLAITGGAMAIGLVGFEPGTLARSLDGPLRPQLLVVFVLMAMGALAAAISRSLLTSLLGVGLVGYSSAIIFLQNGAPDLAFTQFAVETLFLVIVMAVMLRLPLDRRLNTAPLGLGRGTFAIRPRNSRRDEQTARPRTRSCDVGF